MRLNPCISRSTRPNFAIRIELGLPRNIAVTNACKSTWDQNPPKQWNWTPWRSFHDTLQGWGCTPRRFQVGDEVEWKVGDHITKGVIVRVLRQAETIRGKTCHATEESPGNMLQRQIEMNLNLILFRICRKKHGNRARIRP
jgi:hypothetical protein